MPDLTGFWLGAGAAGLGAACVAGTVLVIILFILGRLLFVLRAAHHKPIDVLDGGLADIADQLRDADSDPVNPAVFDRWAREECERNPLPDDHPAAGKWRCTGCCIQARPASGELIGTIEQSRWRWNGERWQHKCFRLEGVGFHSDCERLTPLPNE